MLKIKIANEMPWLYGAVEIRGDMKMKKYCFTQMLYDYMLGKQRAMSWFFLFMCIFTMSLFGGSPVLAASGVFPEPPFEMFNNVVQVTYNTSGASLNPYVNDYGVGYYGYGRHYEGAFTSGNFGIQGTFSSTEDINTIWFEVAVIVGSEQEVYSEALWPGTSNSFDVSLPIPTDVSNLVGRIIVTVSFSYNDRVSDYISGGFRIFVDVNSNNQLPVVDLSYEPAQPIAGQPINFTATASDPDGDSLSYAWYLNGNQQDADSSTVKWSNPGIGEYVLKVVVDDGNGGEAEDQVAFTVTNEVKPYVIAPGYQEGEGEGWGFVDKVFIDGVEVADIEQTLLYTGSQIKTGPGVEILLRTSFGAVMRVNENTQYEVMERKFQTPTNQKVYGRLKDGTCGFYWPKGYEGAKKFEVGTSRVVVGIKGTTFTVSHINDVSTVSVQEGEVEVTNLDTGVVSQVQTGGSLSVRDEGGYVAGNYNYYLPYYSSVDGNWTGLGLANHSQINSALLQVAVYGDNGNLLESERKLIPTYGQEAFAIATNLNDSGWMQVNSHQPLSGLAFVGLSGAVPLMADIPFMGELSTSMVVPYIVQDDDWDTSILVCNPLNLPNDVTLQLINQDGNLQGEETDELAPMGGGEYHLSSLFGQGFQKYGKIKIQSSSGIAAFALYNNLKSGGSYYAGINAVAENADTSASYTYYLPYYSSENGDWTGLGLSNSDNYESAELQVSVYNKAGNTLSSTPVSISVDGQIAFPVAPAGITKGWIQIDSQQPLTGLAFIGSGNGSSLMADIPFIDVLNKKLIIPHVAQDSTWDTTILLCNPNHENALVTIVNVNQIGEISGSSENVIAAQGSGEFPLSALFAGQTSIAGKIQITSSVGLAGFALYSNQKSGGYYFSGINTDVCE